MQQAEVLPQDPEISIFIHAVFDTGLIIDTLNMRFSRYRQYSARTIAHLNKLMPEVKWVEEDPQDIRGADDPNDFLPILNLSYVVAIDPAMLAETSLQLPLPSGSVCTVAFATPRVYFHAQGAGVVSLQATLAWDRDYTLDDLRAVNSDLLSALGSLVEVKLRSLNEVYARGVTLSKAPLYTMPFYHPERATSLRDLLYWSHFVYVLRTHNPADVPAMAAWLSPLMMPMDQNGVRNMAIKPERFIYFGWGRSLYCCPASYSLESVYSYVRLMEIRNYLWKILYDLDRGLRDAVRQGNAINSSKEARLLVGKLHGLDFRVKAFLEELEPFKLTFDHEKIFLLKQTDANWLTSELVDSVESRLEAFKAFYAYTEEALTRTRGERLQAVLNLIGIVATAGSITELINFFDPFFHLAFAERLAGLVISVTIVIFVFLFSGSLTRRFRQR